MTEHPKQPWRPPGTIMATVDPGPELSYREMARFEAAIDTLNQHVGSCMAQIYAEEAKPQPDETVSAHYRDAAHQFAARRRALRGHDAEAINEVLQTARKVKAELNDE
ncbi:MAG: hypothetical protein ACRCTR_07945 [Actinomycetota bacterium]